MKTLGILLLFWAVASSSAGDLFSGLDPALYRRVAPRDEVGIDLRYGSENNFLGKKIYPGSPDCFLHREAAEKIDEAARILKIRYPGYRLLLLDCLRPRSVQKIFWKIVAGTPKQKYVGNPKTGSIHNFGLAVDLTLVDREGKEIDMGTPFDSFEPLAQPALESENLKSGKLSPEHIARRKILREVMVGAGFIQLPVEWWHYDSRPAKDVRKSFKIVE